MGTYKASSAGGFRIVAGRASTRVVVEEPMPAAEAEPAGPSEDYLAGRRDADEESAAQRRALEVRLRQSTVDLPARLTAYFTSFEAQARAEIRELALAAARILLRDAVPDERMIRAALDDVLDQVAAAEVVRIALHPDDLDTLRTSPPAALPAAVAWVGDPELQPGDVVVSTQGCVFDGSVAARLERLREWMHERTEADGGSPDDMGASVD